MTNAPDPCGIDDTSGASDRACVNCGHMGSEHRVREAEVPRAVAERDPLAPVGDAPDAVGRGCGS